MAQERHPNIQHLTSWAFNQCMFPPTHWKSPWSSYVCLCVRHHVSLRRLEQRNARISPSLNMTRATGSVSQHMPVFIRTIVGVSAYLCPSLIPTLYLCVICFAPKHPKTTFILPTFVCVSDIMFHASKLAQYNARSSTKSQGASFAR